MKSTEIKKLLRLQLDQGSGKDKELGSVFLWGQPGVGKSAVVAEVAEEAKVDCIDFRLILCDPTDLRGIPIPYTDEHGNQSAKWIPPDELPREGRGILFFDDFPTAPPLVQASAYQIAIKPHQLGSYKLPEGWVIVGAGNTLKDRSLARPMPKALSNRFTHITYEVNLDDWVNWAIRANISPTVIGFLKWRPELLMAFKPEASEEAFPTPRTWAAVSKAVQVISSKDLLSQVIVGNVGIGAAAEFGSFLKLQDELPDLDVIFQGQNPVPKKIDLKYALVTALVMRAREDQFNRLIQYADHLPIEFGVLMVKMMISRNMLAVGRAKLWSSWCRKHREMIQ